MKAPWWIKIKERHGDRILTADGWTATIFWDVKIHPLFIFLLRVKIVCIRLFNWLTKPVTL